MEFDSVALCLAQKGGCLRFPKEEPLKTEHFWQIIFVLLGALASAYAGYWFGNQPDQTSTIEYRLDYNTNLQRLIGDTDKLKITYAEKNLDALSNISFSITNTSKKNLDKIKIYFEILDKSKLPIFHNVSPPKNYPNEAITLISDKNGIYVFELEFLNRTDSIWDGINFSFYFGGSEPPKIEVKTGTKGVSIQQYSLDNISKLDIAVDLIAEVWLPLIVYLAFVFLLFRFSKSLKKGKAEMYKKNIIEELSKNSDENKDVLATRIFEASKLEPKFKDIVKGMFKKNDS